jgi:hypothetical protein
MLSTRITSATASSGLGWLFDIRHYEQTEVLVRNIYFADVILCQVGNGPSWIKAQSAQMSSARESCTAASRAAGASKLDVATKLTPIITLLGEVLYCTLFAKTRKTIEI